MNSREQQQANTNKPSHRYNAELYERIRVLGKGSFGTAIVHRRQADGALVVLKEIDLHKLKQDADKLAMVIQEARIMSKLSHANIIQYYNAYTRDDSKLVIEMEYARIGTLQTYLSLQTRHLDELEALAIFRQILAGLEYLHSKSIVHLDLKMANIFVTSEGSVKIGDFGIARLMSRPQDEQEHERRLQSARPRLASVGARAASATPTGPAADDTQHYCQLGTLAYSSPERCTGGPTGFKSDIWSLGCLLYELVELKPLFPAKSLAELVMSITQVRFEPMRRADIQPGLRNLFMLMIARQPSDRPTASELVDITNNLLLKHQRGQQRTQQGEPIGRMQPARHANKQPAAPVKPQLPAPPPPQTLSYPHSLVYQVKLSSRDVQVDRVHLPQSKRIKEMAKGRSHYLVLTYDNIVYGWGTRHCGQLGGSRTTAMSSSSNLLCGAGGRPTRGSPGTRHTRSARNSFTARDLQVGIAPGSAGAIPTTPTTVRPPSRAGGAGHLSLTQPSSLASSTQTLAVGAAGPPSTPPLLPAGGADNEPRPLADAPPTSRPFIISELNKRKIVRVAAGNDFSVFLSKTGIVMTCGDGSRGCLGRGELAGSQTPCMVDALLSMDVVGVACGPEHVVAVCGNGQVFAWGNARNGRLGLSPEQLAGEKTYLRRGHLVVVPQHVEFPQPVPIKSAFCGDKCTVFVDAQHTCWACGENTNNRLGLDVRRRFLRTWLIERAWRPARIASLANNKHKIISCQLAANHASYLTSEGKLLVLGQDIDRSYKLRSDLAASGPRGGRSPRELYLGAPRNLENQNYANSRLGEPLSKLIARLLAADQLGNFKHKGQANIVSAVPGTIPKLTRQQKRSIEVYLKRSRAHRKLPFECVLSVACTPKFTLALTNDNRVYFWGARTHNMNDHLDGLADSSRAPSGANLKKSLSIEPQLARSSPDECFIKIGQTNSSLMSSIQLIGSDQPILHARNPQLRAASLADLWILDYTPGCDNSSSCSSSLGSSRSSWSCSIQSNSSHDSKQCHCHCQSRSHFEDDTNALETDPQRHDAILEPQPIVSLYVPPTFGYNNCRLQLVNLFCFDEDRFFLVLDTTVKLTPGPGQLLSRSCSRRGSLSLKQLSSPAAALAQHGQHTNQAHQHHHHHHSMPTGVAAGAMKGLTGAQQVAATTTARTLTATRLNIVEESRSSGDSQRQQVAATFTGTRDPGNDQTQREPVDSGTLECCRKVAADDDERREQRREAVHQTHLLLDSTAAGVHLKPEFSNGGTVSSVTPPSVSAHTGLSLEEPRSMSTFAPNFVGRHLMVRAPSLGSLAHDREDEAPMMRKLSFERSSHNSHSFGPSHLLPRGKIRGQRRDRGQRRRKGRRTLNQSESTAVTTEPDDTSCMPTWVRNEYLQQLSSGASSPDGRKLTLQQQQQRDEPLSTQSDQSCSPCDASEDEELAEEATCVGARNELDAVSVTSAEPTLTHDANQAEQEQQVFDQHMACDRSSSVESREGNSRASLRSEFSISTAIGVENGRIIDALAEQTDLRPEPDDVSGPSCSAESQAPTTLDDNDGRPASKNSGHPSHLCRSQSNISTVNKWFRLQLAEDLARTSGPLDLACGGEGAVAERMAESLLECGVYKTAMPLSNTGRRETLSSSSSTMSSGQDQGELHDHRDAPHDRHELRVSSDGSSLIDQEEEEEEANKNVLTRQTEEAKRGARLRQQRALSQSTSCLPIEERYTRISDPIAHDPDDNSARPPVVIMAQRKARVKTGSRSSLTSMRKSLVRIFC